MTGGSDRLPFNWFPLQGTNASQLGASSGSPSTDRSSRLCGTCPMTRQASPSTEEVHAPRTSPGVYASPMDSTSCTSRSFLASIGCVFTHSPTLWNPYTIQLFKLRLPSIALYKMNVNMLSWKHEKDTHNRPFRGQRQRGYCSHQRALWTLIQ